MLFVVTKTKHPSLIIQTNQKHVQIVCTAKPNSVKMIKCASWLISLGWIEGKA